MGEKLRKAYLKRKFTKFAKIDRDLETMTEDDLKKSAIFREYFYHRECKYQSFLFIDHFFKDTQSLL